MWRRVDPAGLPMALNTLALLESERQNPVAARPLFDEALAAAREAGNRVHLHQITGTKATFEDTQGNVETALVLHAAALDIAVALGDRVSAVIYEHNGACTLRSMGRIEESATIMRQLAQGFVDANEPALLIVFAEDLASVLGFDQPELAVRLLAGADQLRDRLVMPRRADQDSTLAGAVASTRAALNEPDWAEAYRLGRDVVLEETVLRAADLR